MNKRGSHVGMMISFMLFVMFLIFVRIIFEPTINSDETKQKFIEGIERSVIESASEETIITTVSVSSSSVCLSISNYLDDFNAYDGVVIKDENGDTIQASISSGDSSTLQIERTGSSIDFFKIYSSEGFDSLNEESASCTALSDSNIKGTKRKSYVFERKITDLISADYENFRKSLNMPNDTEIGVEFEFENKTIIKTPEKNITANIYIKESSVEYIDSDANVMAGKLRVKIW